MEQREANLIIVAVSLQEGGGGEVGGEWLFGVATGNAREGAHWASLGSSVRGGLRKRGKHRTAMHKPLPQFQRCCSL